MNIENLILTFSYLAIFFFMITNGIFSLPSSQFIYVTAGFFVSSGELLFWPIIISGTIGNIVGNSILYEMTRSKGLKYIIRWKGFSEKRITALHQAFEKKGLVIIFIGKFLPGVKVLVPVVAGIACMNRKLYVAVIAITSFMWACALTYFGFYFGKNYDSGKFWWTTVVLMILTIIAIRAFYRYIQIEIVKK